MVWRDYGTSSGFTHSSIEKANEEARRLCSANIGCKVYVLCAVGCFIGSAAIEELKLEKANDS